MVTHRGLAAVILAAGRGTRMNSERPKVLHEAAGVSLIQHVLETVSGIHAAKIIVVIGPEWPLEAKHRFSLKKVLFVLQKHRFGTAHAVLQARPLLRHWKGNVLVLPADAPCLRPETLRKLIEVHRKECYDATVLTASVDKPFGYGRLIRRNGWVSGIREELEATEAERKIREINSGVYVFRAEPLLKHLGQIQPSEKKKEYYLTDVIEKMVESHQRVSTYETQDPEEILGVNARKDLAQANRICHQRELERHMESGVTIIDSDKTFIQKGVAIGRDTTIYPFTWIERGARIGRNCEIGPFAKIRSGSEIGDGAVIGSFVEVVRSRVGAKTLVKHLTYLGDAELGRDVNVGAGTVTANFDGRRKSRTVVGDSAFLGCNTVLIAPVRLGRRVKTGAGAVVCAHQVIPAGKTVVGVPARTMKNLHKSGKES